ncbi:MAG TPA: DUF1588 domain-containing protein [Polyangiaceae bacterium]|nr:DUF1588 domain-containing protein [Polyangiaceae bacterium]
MLRRLRRELFFIVLPLLPLATGCVEGSLADGVRRGTDAAGSDSGSGPHAGSGSGASAGSGSVSSAGSGDTTSPFLPARIRRLTNAEYENSARAVVGTSDPVTADFAPDTRQSGYTLNDAQRVDSLLVKQIASAASKLALQVRAKVATLAPCDVAAGNEACAKTFIQSFASHAYRRPLADEEVAKLVDLFRIGAEGATYADGIELVATAVLQSAGFLYLTEVGDGSNPSQVRLTPYETASALSYLVTAGPPDAELTAAAANGQLESAEQRSAIFTRLMNGADPSAARARVLRVVQEWLGTDRLMETAKDSTVYPQFADLKPAMLGETGAFLQQLLDRKSGTVGELLGANWTAMQASLTQANAGLTAVYGGTAMANGEISLPQRRGILNQGAFLSVHAHASETGPVLRGVTVLRRVACQTVNSPSVLMLTIPPLAPDPNKTMRQRMEAHVKDPKCAGCHKAIDSFGFSFEQYDGMGRPQTTDNKANVAVDSRTTVNLSLDFDGDYADSNQLASALSSSAAVRECFARNIFRASAGRSQDDVQAAELAFINYWKTVPAPAPDATHPTPASAAEGSILEALRAVVTSPNFTVRRAQ